MENRLSHPADRRAVRRQQLTGFVTASVLAAFGCSPSSGSECNDEVVTHADTDVDFSAVRTFAIVPEEDIPDELPGDLPDDAETHLATTLEAARQELEEIGLVEVDPDVETPDVWLFDVAATESQSGVIWTCMSGWVWWGGWGWVWDPCAWIAPIQVSYSIGTVIVGLADAEHEKVVFGGVIQGALTCGNTETRIQEGVRAVFAEYPEPPGKSEGGNP